MRPEFEQIINRLGRIRARMEEYIMDKGGKTTGAETLMDYTNAICSIPDLGNVRNGYETFSGNTVLEEIPECLADASQYFTSMYKGVLGRCLAVLHLDVQVLQGLHSAKESASALHREGDHLCVCLLWLHCIGGD